MSTFNGIIKEFPDIRIDFFQQTSPPSRPALAYFLSHVHSDHLVGLDTLRSPFVYCSPATREILLRLEKYPHRMNFSKGILEVRQQTYKHLRNLLKPIPLETPTQIELSPGKSIRVTLFDANHCVGAVCFLIEGSGHAILYTGDVRSESWWVASICRNPILIPYVSAPVQYGSQLKRLDCIYLDTTFAVKDDMYRKFPSKAEGLSELLSAMSRYPRGTHFYFDAWTFGYEEVWQALAAFLGSLVHVDPYRYRLYLALVNGNEPKAPEAAKLMGFRFGNHHQPGCLTSQPAMLHSCEKGTGCDVWHKDFVRITPIISRHNGVDIAELGAGGGHGDLNQRHELEVFDTALMGQLIALCASKLQDQPQLLASVMEMLCKLVQERGPSISLDHSSLTAMAHGAIESANHETYDGMEHVPLERLVPAIVRLVTKQKFRKCEASTAAPALRSDGLPKQIRFPYSRHSSYLELCELVGALQPQDIHPCTVDAANWSPECSMASLFGHLYSALPCFTHDQEMLQAQSMSSRACERDTVPPSTQDCKLQVDSGTSEAPEQGVKRRRNRKRRRNLDQSAIQGRTTKHCWPPNEIDHYSSSQALNRPSEMPLGGNCGQAAQQDPLSASRSAQGPQLRSSARSSADEKVFRKESVVDAPRYGRLTPIHGLRHSSQDSTADHNRNDLAHVARDADSNIRCEISRPPHQASAPLQENPMCTSVLELVEQNASESAHESTPPQQLEPPVEAENSLPTPEAIRRARRQEVYEAAVGVDGMWSRVSLISTGGGHQSIEEEL